MNEYYVYILLNPLKSGNYTYGIYSFDYEPFYVGKGKGKRMYYHSVKNKESSKNNIKFGILKKINESSRKPIYLKIKENLYEDESFELEKKLIDLIGLRIDNKGPLSNMTYGGEGVSGYKHNDKTKKLLSEKAKGRIISEAQRKAISNANKGRIFSKESRKKISKANKGRVKSIETRNKISKGNKGKKISIELREYYSKKFKGEGNPFYGKKHTDQTKKKISKANKGNTPHNIGIKPVYQYDKDWNLIKKWDNLKDVCEKTGYPKSNICRSIKKLNKCMGYYWRYIPKDKP